MKKIVKKSFKYNFLIVIFILLIAQISLFSQDKNKVQKKEAKKGTYEKLFQVKGHAEVGFVSVLSHKIKYDPNDTYLNYVKDGGQDNLFFNWRISLDLLVKDVHSIVFLYQPLELNSTVRLKKDLVMDGQTFDAGSGVNLRYSFPFYRLSYMYDFFRDLRQELTLGFGLQIRNAAIEFESVDDLTGQIAVSKRNIGIVPLIKMRGRYTFSNGFFLGGEIDGIYAPISVLNGSDNDTVGAFLDVSFRGGYTFNKYMDAFLNVRYLGGGAANEDPKDYTKNWIHLMTVTIGVTGTI